MLMKRIEHSDIFILEPMLIFWKSEQELSWTYLSDSSNHKK